MLAAAAAVLLLLYRWENRPTAQTEDDPYAGEDESLTYYNGGWYARRDVETVLVMGVDKYAAQTSGDNYNQQQQADFLLLLVVDRTAGICRVLPLNRDTMTEITALGLAGEQVGTFNGQLALSHTYGSGGLDSARNTGRAVSSLLYGVDIDHVMAFTMDAVPVINDAVGGVTMFSAPRGRSRQPMASTTACALICCKPTARPVTVSTFSGETSSTMQSVQAGMPRSCTASI